MNIELEKLTKEQEELMLVTKDEWISNFYKTTSIDKKEFEKGIEWLYIDLLKKKKPKVVYVDDWFSCIISIHILKNLASILGDNVSSNLENTVRNTVRNTIGSNVGNTINNYIINTVRSTIASTISSTLRNTIASTISSTVRNTMGSTVENTMNNYIINTVRNIVGSTIWDTIYSTVNSTIWDTIGSNVENTIGSTIENTVGSTIGNNVGIAIGNTFLQYSSYVNSYSNFGWVSFYDYFEKIGMLDNEDFRKYKRFIKSGAFQVYTYENIVFAVEPPVIFRNQNNQIHSIEKASVVFKNGYKQYYVNNFNIAENLFLKLKEDKYTIEDFAQETNEEAKSASIAFLQEKYGEEYIFNFFRKNLDEISTYTDIKDEKYLLGTTNGQNIGVYTLFKGLINNNEVAYVRCFCPSTDRMFFLGVDPKNDNPKDAIASLYRVPRVLKDSIKSIHRQGERYTTIFNEETTNKLKNNELTSKELKDLVPLSGEDYFNLIKYEY